MSDPIPETSPQEPRPSRVFKINRLQIGTNVLIQVLLVAFLVGLTNFVAFRHYKRWDLSMDDRHSLGEQTRNVLAGLESPVRFIVFFSAGSPAFRSLDQLLKEYQYASEGKIEVEFIDAVRNFGRARDLQAEFKFEATENVVIATHGGRSKFLTELDLGEVDDSPIIFGEAPRLVEFSGEQALTAAILELTEARETRMAVLQGQGQPGIGPDGPLSALLRFVERQNVRAEALDPGLVDAIPDGVDLVLLAGARYDLPERSVQVLVDYWKDRGRLIVLLDPNAKTPNLDAFLTSVGIQPNNDRVLRTVNLGTVTGVLREVSAEFLPGSPATRSISGVTTLFTGATQSLTLEQDKVQDRNIRLTPVIQAGEGYWGETNHAAPEGTPILFEPASDTHPPIRIAATAEMGALDDDRVQLNSARLIVVGNADFILDGTLNELNLDFLLNSLNWLVNREQMLGISAKEIRYLTLTLSEEQVANIGLLSMVAMPGAAGLLGLLVYLRRRK